MCSLQVLLVYEGQGEPFWLRPGDCVLQPPGIRHRVLESRGGLEVLEIASPAEHETTLDHEMQLPTGAITPDRLFGGQRFVRHQAATAPWTEHIWDDIPGAGEQRLFFQEMGIAAATCGLASCIRYKLPWGGKFQLPGSEFAFMFILEGAFTLELLNRPNPTNDTHTAGQPGASITGCTGGDVAAHLATYDSVVIPTGSLGILRTSPSDTDHTESYSFLVVRLGDL